MIQPLVTATICTHNRPEFVLQAVNSLKAQSLDSGQYTILVIDNSTNQDTADLFQAQSAGARPVEYVRESSPGLSRARNRAIKHCKTSLLAFIDDDAIADADWLASICREFEQCDPQVGILGGEVNPIWPAPPPHWLHESLYGYLSINQQPARHAVITDQPWLLGTNITFRMSAVEQAGLFRTDLGRIGALELGNEELEYIDRLKSHGWKALYSPFVKVSHHIHPQRLTRQWIRRRVVWQAISDMIMRDTGYDESVGISQLEDFIPDEITIGELVSRLFDSCEKPDLFYKQCIAIHGLASLLHSDNSAR